jgi:hypothetical protein
MMHRLSMGVKPQPTGGARVAKIHRDTTHPGPVEYFHVEKYWRCGKTAALVDPRGRDLIPFATSRDETC